MLARSIKRAAAAAASRPARCARPQAVPELMEAPALSRSLAWLRQSFPGRDPVELLQARARAGAVRRRAAWRPTAGARPAAAPIHPHTPLRGCVLAQSAAPPARAATPHRLRPHTSPPHQNPSKPLKAPQNPSKPLKTLQENPRILKNIGESNIEDSAEYGEMTTKD